MSQPRKPSSPPKVGVASEPGHDNLEEDRVERELDEALQDTFPASDPIALTPDDDGEPESSPLDEGLETSFPASDPVAVRTGKPGKD